MSATDPARLSTLAAAGATAPTLRAAMAVMNAQTLASAAPRTPKGRP